MMALYRPALGTAIRMSRSQAGVGQASRESLGFGCAFLDIDLDGRLDLVAVNGHIDETVRNIRGNVGYAQPRTCFNTTAREMFHDVALARPAPAFAAPKVARGLAYGDFDRDGDLDLLVTTNKGPAYLYRNDVTQRQPLAALHLTGTKSNRDAIGAVVRVTTPEATQSRMVKTGSSYLSQSELTLTFGLGPRDTASRLTIEWPSGATQEFSAVHFGGYECLEGQPLKKLDGY
jgi:enediyne biosynthesis protein E4